MLRAILQGLAYAEPVPLLIVLCWKLILLRELACWDSTTWIRDYTF